MELHWVIFISGVSASVAIALVSRWSNNALREALVKMRTGYEERLNSSREYYRQEVEFARQECEDRIKQMGNVSELAEMLEAIGISIDEPVEDFDVFNQSVSSGCYSCDVSYKQDGVETGFHLVSVRHWEDNLSESVATDDQSQDYTRNDC